MHVADGRTRVDDRGVVEWHLDRRRHHHVVVDGDFDLGLSGPVGALLEAIALTEPASVHLVADRLTLFGSWGLRALERATDALNVVGVRLVISGASQPMRQVLTLFDGVAPPIVADGGRDDEAETDGGASWR